MFSWLRIEIIKLELLSNKKLDDDALSSFAGEMSLQDSFCAKEKFDTVLIEYNYRWFKKNTKETTLTENFNEIVRT